MRGKVDPFEALGDKLIEDAERVKCPLEDFVAGLRSIARRANERAELSAVEVTRPSRAGAKGSK